MKRLRWRGDEWSGYDAIVEFDGTGRRDSNHYIRWYTISSDGNSENTSKHTGWYPYYQNRREFGRPWSGIYKLGGFATVEEAKDTCNAHYNDMTLEQYRAKNKPKRRGLTIEISENG